MGQLTKRNEDVLDKDGRMTINFSPPVRQNLERIASGFGITPSTLVKMLVEHGLIVEGVLESGGEIFARAPNGQTFKLARTGEKRKVALEDETGELFWKPKL